MKYDDTVNELGLTIMRQCALPLQQRFIFNGRFMEPSATLAAHNVDVQRLSFVYEFSEQLRFSLNAKLEEERRRLDVGTVEWKRWLVITDKNGLEVRVQWNGSLITTDFALLQDRFPISVVLESKVLAEVNAAVITCSEDCTARIWDASSGQCIYVLRGHTGTVTNACFAPDNASVVTCSEDHSVKIWSLVTGECLHTFKGHTDSVSSASFSPDRTSLLTLSDDCTARLWNVQSLSCTFTLRAHTAAVFLARFEDDGNILTAGRDGKMFLWDGRTGVYMRTINKELPPVELYSYSPGGRFTVTASPDRQTSVWNLETGRCQVVLNGHERQVTHAIFSPSSEAMVMAAEATP